MTGVLRISKESIFSALNNLRVSSVLHGPYPDVMGFTRDEVAQMALDLDAMDNWTPVETGAVLEENGVRFRYIDYVNSSPLPIA